MFTQARRGLPRVRRGQEGNDCLGDGAGRSPGQVMACLRLR